MVDPKNTTQECSRCGQIVKKKGERGTNGDVSCHKLLAKPGEVGGIMGFLELDRRLGEIQDDPEKELYDRNALLIAQAICDLAEELYKLSLR